MHEENKQQEIVIPPGWEQCHTNNGKIYYKNHNDQSTHWNIPEEAYWSRCITNDGRTYYQCHRDKTTHWNLPKGIKLSEKMNQFKSKSSLCEPAEQSATNKNIPFKQMPNNQKKTKPKKDVAYWQELGWKCGLKRDMTEYINEVLNDDEYKNASPQQQAIMMQQLKLQQQKMAMHQHSMQMNQFNHQQNMFDMANSAMREVSARQHVQMMNASNWGPNADRYYLKKDQLIHREYDPYGQF